MLPLQIQERFADLISVNEKTTFGKFYKELMARKTPVHGIYANFSVYNEKAENKLLEMILALKRNAANTQCLIATPFERVFEKQEVEVLARLDDVLRLAQKSNKAGVHFATNEFIFTLNQVVEANNKLNRIEEEVKQLSPFEKLSYIYSWVTDFGYNPNESSASCSVVGVLTQKFMKCYGHGYLMQELCKRAGIDCFVAAEKYTGGLHITNIVKIKDEKYGIDGCYVADAFYDSVKKRHGYLQSVESFMVPLAYNYQIKHHKGVHSNEFIEALRNEESFIEHYKSIKSGIRRLYNLKEKEALHLESVDSGKRQDQSLRLFANKVLTKVDKDNILNSPFVPRSIVSTVMKNVMELRLRNCERKGIESERRIISDKLKDFWFVEKSLDEQEKELGRKRI